MTAADGSVVVRAARGSLYLDSGVCADLFAGAQAVAVLVSAAELVVLPVRNPGGGGLLLKVRNAHGDRVVHATEALREAGIGEDAECELRGSWDPQRSALVLRLSA